MVNCRHVITQVHCYYSNTLCIKLYIVYESNYSLCDSYKTEHGKKQEYKGTLLCMKYQYIVN